MTRRRPLDWLLSGDRPGTPLLAVLLLVVFVALAAAPFLFPGQKALGVAARICVFIVLAASYDVLLGYTGIVSFAHTMFFGMGAYGVAIGITKIGVGWPELLLGGAGGVALAVAVAIVIGLLSLRVRAIFFAMITLAVASFALILAAQMREFTGGEDGLTFSLPRLLSRGYRLTDEPVLGVRLDGRHVAYYIIFLSSLVLFLAMLRIVNSPFGRVLQAIRENEFRAEALGYRTVVYRTIASGIAAGMAALAGVLLVLAQPYAGPDAVLSFNIMVDILLMVVIGGMGTLYGPALGAVLMVLAQYYLQALMGGVGETFAGLPVIPALFHPDRWLLWLGILFVLIVYFFPAGLVGKLRERAAR